MKSYKNITPSQMKEYNSIMIEGSTQLNNLKMELGYKTTKKLRSVLFKTNPCSIEHLCSVHKDLSQAKIKKFKKALVAIQNVRNIESDLIAGYTGAVVKFAKKYHTVCRLSLEDCVQVGFMVLLDCIYAYKNIENKFITYIYTSMKNTFINLGLENNKFSRLNNKCVKLLETFNKLKESRMVAHEKYDDETIINLMGLSAKQKNNLKKALLSFSICNESEIAYSSESDESFDFTSMRKNIDHKENNELYYVRMALEETNLTAFERKIVDTFLCPYYGWQSDLAKNSFNPKTQKPYSHRGIGFLLEQAINKIKFVYFSKYAETEAA